MPVKKHTPQHKSSGLAMRSKADFLSNKTTPSQKRAEAYCRVNPAWFLNKVERFYPLDEQLISRFEDRWHWKSLSENNSLSWSELITRYADRLDWFSLSNNKSLPWSEELIARYSDRWNWELLSKNTAVPASQNIIARFADKWDSLRSTPLMKDDKKPVFGIFSPTPIYECAGHDRPICFNLTKKQVESILEECFKNAATSAAKEPAPVRPATIWPFPSSGVSKPK